MSSEYDVPSDDYDAEDISHVFSQPCTVHSVVIEGNEKTKSEAIERYLHAAKQAKTLGQLQHELQNAKNELLHLGIFDSVDIVADEGPEDGSDDAATVYVLVKENSGVGLSVGSYIKDHSPEPVLEASGSLKNRLGNGESLDGQLSLGKESSTHFNLSLHWPHFNTKRRGHLRKEIYQTWSHFKRYSSHTQSLRGVSLTYSEGNHSLGYAFSWRNNRHEENASATVRRHLGHSLLSSISYGFNLDRLNSHLRPREGYSVRLRTQLAGIGPGNHFIRFIKQVAEVHLAYPLPILNAALTTNLQAGLVLPWSSTGRRPMINDKFMMGGPNPLRGFRSYGVGPTDKRTGDKGGLDRIGGDIMLAASSALSFDLRSAVLRKLGIHGHTFACAGTLLPLSAASGIVQSPLQTGRDFLDSVRCSAGVGLVSTSSFLGRLELNYCWVLRKQSTDRVVKHGFQVCWNGGLP